MWVTSEIFIEWMNEYWLFWTFERKFSDFWNSRVQIKICKHCKNFDLLFVSLPPPKFCKLKVDCGCHCKKLRKIHTPTTVFQKIKKFKFQKNVFPVSFMTDCLFSIRYQRKWRQWRFDHRQINITFSQNARILRENRSDAVLAR